MSLPRRLLALIKTTSSEATATGRRMYIRVLLRWPMVLVQLERGVGWFVAANQKTLQPRQDMNMLFAWGIAQFSTGTRTLAVP